MYQHEDIVSEWVGIDWKQVAQGCKGMKEWMGRIAGAKEKILEKAGIPEDPRREKTDGKGKGKGGGKKKEKEQEDDQTEQPTHVEAPAEWRRTEKCLRMVVDSKSLQEVLCGHAVLTEEAQMASLIASTEILVKLRSVGWEAPHMGEDPWLWRPRGFNRCSDSMCNIVMNHGSSFRKFYPGGLTNRTVCCGVALSRILQGPFGP